MSFQGLLLGLVCFLCIGAFHPIVVYAEYYFSKKIAWLFFLIGLSACIASLFLPSLFLSGSLAIFGISCFWSIHELYEQEKEWKRAGFRKIQRESKSSTKIMFSEQL
jgi:membrane protein